MALVLCVVAIAFACVARAGGVRGVDDAGARLPGEADEPIAVDARVRARVLASGLTLVTCRVKEGGEASSRLTVSLTIAGGTADAFAMDGGHGAAQVGAKLSTAGSAVVAPRSVVGRFAAVGLRPSDHLSHEVGYTHTRITLDAPAPMDDRVPGEDDEHAAILRTAASYFGSLLIRGPHADAEAVERATRSLIDAARDAGSASRRLTERLLPELPGGATLGEAFPASIAPLEAGVTAEAVRAFGERFYKPERAALVVVSSRPHDEVMREVVGALGPAGRGGGGVPDVGGGVNGEPEAGSDLGLPAGAGGRVGAEDRGLVAPLVQAVRFEAGRPEPQTVGELRAHLAELVAAELMRAAVLEGASEAGQARVVGGSAARLRIDPAVTMWTAVYAAADREAWPHAASMLAGSLAAARDPRSISDASLQAARDAVVVRERRLAGERSGAALTRAVVRAWRLTGRAQIVDAAARAELARKLVPRLTRDEIAGAAERALDPASFAFAALTPEGGDDNPPDGEASIVAALDRAVRSPADHPWLTRPEAAGHAPPPLTGEQTHFPGEPVLPDELVFEPGDPPSVSARFPNNITVRAAIEPGDADDSDADARPADAVRVVVTLGAGPLTDHTGSKALSWGAQTYLSEPAIGGRSSAEVAAFMRGRGLEISPLPHPELVVFEVRGGAGSAGQALELVRGMLTDPTVEPPPAALWVRAVDAARTNPASARALALAEATASPDDPRTDPTPEVDAEDPTASAQRVRRALTGAAVSVGVTGAGDMRSLIEAASATIGAIPERPPFDAELLAAHELRGERRSAARRVVTRELQSDRAGIVVGRTLPAVLTERERAAAEVLAELLRRRVESALRGEPGAPEAVEVSLEPPRGPLALAKLAVSFNADPDAAEAARSIADAAFHSLAAATPGEGELRAARRAVERRLRERSREPRAIALGLSLGPIYPHEHPNAAARRVLITPTIAGEELRRLAARIDTQDRSLSVLVMPSGAD